MQNITDIGYKISTAHELSILKFLNRHERGNNISTLSVHVLSLFSYVRLFVTLWTTACQAPPSIGFSWQKYWSGLQFPLPGELSNPEIKPTSLMSPALAGGFFT